MRIEILGTGCAKCNTLAENARLAAERAGIDYELVKVSNLAQIASYGVMVTPALVIDGTVKISGKVASPDEIEALLK